MTLDITALDLFCGAGGSSTGLTDAGVQVKTAINHWQLAIDTHSTNHPTTDHDCADVRKVHPSFYPKTTIFWASPECTNHSVAKGKRRKSINQMDLFGETGIDPAEERSRATMREVVEFAAYHKHEIVIVENVVDIRFWAHYDSWLQEMINLGYDHKALYINAQFFGVPQSRDRIYVVFWRKGNRAPDLDFRPTAMCEKHGLISAVQSWKKTNGVQWGRYKRQYVYRCPTCAAEVKPFYTPAWTVIDWSLPSVKIGDRDKPLKPKTIDRVRAGLRKYARLATLVDLGFGDGDRLTPLDQPMPTQTTQQTVALMQPFISAYYGFGNRGEDTATTPDTPLPTIPTENRFSLVTPPFLTQFYGVIDQTGIDEALPTLMGTTKHALVLPPFLAVMKNSHNADGTYTLPPVDMDGVLTTIVASGSQHALITPAFLTQYYGSIQDAPIDDAIPTITGTDRHALVTPPILISTNHSDVERNTPVDAPLPTVMTQTRPSLVTPPLLVSTNYFDDRCIPVSDPMPTQTTATMLALLIGDELVKGLDVEALLPECGFRMLEPRELKLAMSFPDSYIILGNKREQVRQTGNAVAVKVARAIAERCIASLT